MASEITVYVFHISKTIGKHIQKSEVFQKFISKLDKEKDAVCLFLTPDRAIIQLVELCFLDELIKHFGNERRALKALFRAFRKYLYAVKEPARRNILCKSGVKREDISEVMRKHKRFELEGNEVVIYLEEPENENSNGVKKDQ